MFKPACKSTNMALISALLCDTEQQEATDDMDERWCSGISECCTEAAAVRVWPTPIECIEEVEKSDKPAGRPLDVSSAVLESVAQLATVRCLPVSLTHQGIHCVFRQCRIPRASKVHLVI